MMIDDSQLLNHYIQTGSAEAFAQLVSRHINVVYAAARRQVHRADLADDVTQAVFIVLSRKATSIRNGTLSGWLQKTTHYAAKDALKLERRRAYHERRAAEMASIHPYEPPEPAWETVVPAIDAGLAQLSEQQRSAIILRFFEGKSFGEVGTTLGTTEDAARFSVSRALTKLRRFLSRRGLIVSGAALGTMLAEHAAEAAPPCLTASILAATQGSTATTTSLAIAKGAMHMMMWNQVKVAAVWAIVGLLLFGAGTAAVRGLAAERPHQPQADPIQSPISLDRSHDEDPAPMGALKLKLVLNAPQLKPPAVQWAIFPEDPIPAFKRRVEQLSAGAHGPAGEIVRPEIATGPLGLCAAWNVGFRQVTGEDTHMLFSGTDAPKNLVVSSPQDKCWLVTKMSMVGGKPLGWCVPIQPQPGKVIELTLTPENAITFDPAVPNALKK